MSGGVQIATSDLRRHLQDMTENGKPRSHPRIIEQLRETLPHSIDVLTRNDSDLAFNCVMHALGLVRNDEYIRLARRCLHLDASDDPAYQGVHADTGLIEFLIRRDFIAARSTARKASLVVYSFGERVKHIGTLISPVRVVSKWGMGHLYAHGLSEVPSGYGNVIRYFAPQTPERVLDEFIGYAISRGVPLLGD